MWYTIKHYIKFLKRNKIVSFINLTGFVISMTVLFTLIAFIVRERSVNSNFPNQENIYRIFKSNSSSTSSIVPVTLREDVKANIPDVDKFGIYTFNKGLYKYNDHTGIADLAAINNDFLQIFSMNCTKQSGELLEMKNNAMITRSFSNQLFGRKNPIGEIIFIGDLPFTIIGIIDNMPNNASFHFNIAISYHHMSVSNQNFQTSGQKMEKHSLVNAIISLKPNGDMALVENKISNMLNKWGAFKDTKVHIEPLDAVYFNAIESDQMRHANVKLIYLLLNIAVVIIFMAIFNYINLSISSSYNRLKEIGIKRTSGASKKGIFIQLMTESMITSVMAMCIAIILSFAFLDIFPILLNTEIPLQLIIHQPSFLLTILLVIIITGLIGGIYPAYIFSRFSPIKLVNNTEKIKRKSSGRWVLAFQFIISIVLVVSLLFIQKQLHYIQYKDLGFNKEQLIKLNLTKTTAQKWKLVKEELLKHPNIIDVAGSSGTIMQTVGWSMGHYAVGGTDKRIESKNIGIDKDFLNTFKIKLIAGRNITSTDSVRICLINQHLYNELEWENLDGKTFGGKSVVGVVANFNYNSLHTQIGNLELVNNNKPDILSIRTTKDIAKTLDDIKAVCKQFEPGVTPKITFYDEWIESMYQKEKSQLKAITMFAVIAILIASLGLFGISMLITLRKTKEIGIRKINGASIKNVMLMLIQEFIVIISIAFVIAT